jgi:hypothetical protein
MEKGKLRYNKFRQLHTRNRDEIIYSLERAATVCPKDETALLYEANKISLCGAAIHTIKCKNCGTNHFKSFERCKSKYCALCNKVKASIWTSLIVRWLYQWLDQGNYVVFLNFTIKDTDSLSEGLKQLQGAWNFMTGQSVKYKKLFHTRFVGGFNSIEVKTGKNSQQWHPHMHSLVLKDKWSYDVDVLDFIWRSSVNKAGGVCEQHPYISKIHVDKVPGAENLKTFGSLRELRKKGYNLSEEDYKCVIAENVREVCKYITKFDWKKEPPERIGELYTSLKGKRQYSVWGRLKGLRDEAEALLAHKSNDEVQDFICQVCGCTRGEPNKLYQTIWEEEAVIIKDFKNTLPERLYPPEMIEQVKVTNNLTTLQQKSSQRIWVQENIFGDDSHTLPD